MLRSSKIKKIRLLSLLAGTVLACGVFYSASKEVSAETETQTVLAYGTENGVNQIRLESAESTNKNWAKSFDTSVKYGEEEGSTAIKKKSNVTARKQLPVCLGIVDPATDYVGTAARLTGRVYVKDDDYSADGQSTLLNENGNPVYKLSLTKGYTEGVNLGALIPNQWNEITIDIARIAKELRSGAQFKLSDFRFQLCCTWTQAGQDSEFGWSGWDTDSNDEFYFSSFTLEREDSYKIVDANKMGALIWGGNTYGKWNNSISTEKTYDGQYQSVKLKYTGTDRVFGSQFGLSLGSPDIDYVGKDTVLKLAIYVENADYDENGVLKEDVTDGGPKHQVALKYYGINEKTQKNDYLGVLSSVQLTPNRWNEISFDLSKLSNAQCFRNETEVQSLSSFSLWFDGVGDKTVVDGKTFDGWKIDTRNTFYVSSITAEGKSLTYSIGDTVTTALFSQTADMSVYASAAGEAAGDQNVFIGWETDGKIYSPNAEISLSKGSIRAKAKYLNAYLHDGASIRLSENDPGLRFAALLNKEDYEALKSAENFTITYTLTDVESGKSQSQTVTEANFTSANRFGDETGVYHYLYAAITGIREADYDRKFSASVSISFTSADGVTVTKELWKNSDENQTQRSLRQVADSALADEETTWTEKQRSILEKFATPAQGGENGGRASDNNE